MRRNKFLLGAAIGVAAGIVAGLLTAPKTGRATRADIARQAKLLKAKAAKRKKRA